MEVTGKIKKINETKTFGASGFKKRELVITTNEQYPQVLLLEFVQDKCAILDKYNVDDNVTVSINLRGREWENDKKEIIYFNTIQGWRIEKIESNDVPVQPFEEVGDDLIEEDPQDLPF